MVAVDSDQPLTPTFLETKRLGSLPGALTVLPIEEALMMEPAELIAEVGRLRAILSASPAPAPAPPPDDDYAAWAASLEQNHEG